MESSSKLEAIIKNLFFGVIGQILLILLNFISRTIFIKYLGVEYLGINGLFTNILFVLNLADLGLGTAITYSLYKPLAENDKEKINALIIFFKSIYQKIALVVFIFGIILVPFLDKLVNLEGNIDNIYIYYILYVINSSISYLFVYKTTIIFADQKNYILKKYGIYSSIINFILQCISLIFFESFILYLLSMIFTTFLNNYLGARKAETLYLLKNEKKVMNIIDKKIKKELFSNVKSMFIYRISGVIMNNTTNIFISIFVGTVWVGYYSNYMMLITGIISLTTIIVASVQASIGNLVNTSYIKDQVVIFDYVNFVIFALIGLLSIVFYTFVDIFINFWIGKEFILNNYIVMLITLNFFIPNVLYATWMFRDTTNLLKKTKYVALITAIINICLILLLQDIFKLEGILIAAVIARLMTNFWYEPYLLFKTYFKQNPLIYFKKILIYIIVLLGIGFFNKYLISFVDFTNIISVILGGILDFIFISILYSLVFYKTEEFKYTREKFLEKFVKKFINK